MCARRVASNDSRHREAHRSSSGGGEGARWSIEPVLGDTWAIEGWLDLAESRAGRGDGVGGGREGGPGDGTDRSPRAGRLTLAGWMSQNGRGGGDFGGRQDPRGQKLP